MRANRLKQSEKRHAIGKNIVKKLSRIKFKQNFFF